MVSLSQMMEDQTSLGKLYIKVSQFTLVQDDITYKLNVHDKGHHILYMYVYNHCTVTGSEKRVGTLNLH